jgi:uncharacterized protein (TIGR02246 family)
MPAAMSPPAERNQAMSAAQPISETEARAWLAQYKSAWQDRDAELAASLFTPDAYYREKAFGDPCVGRDAIKRYWQNRVVEQQRDASFEPELWAVRDTHAFVQWQARFTWLPINGIMELSGVTKLDFATGDEAPPLCRSLEEWIAVSDH